MFSIAPLLDQLWSLLPRILSILVIIFYITLNKPQRMPTKSIMNLVSSENRNKAIWIIWILRHSLRLYSHFSNYLSSLLWLRIWTTWCCWNTSPCISTYNTLGEPYVYITFFSSNLACFSIIIRLLLNYAL